MDEIELAATKGDRARQRGLVALALIPINTAFYFLCIRTSPTPDWFPVLFTILALAQLILGIIAVVGELQARRRGGSGNDGILFGVIAIVGAITGWLAGAVGILLTGLGSLGGAWGRPLRIRGRQLHPSLKEGADWTLGDRPSPVGLDEDTRRALEALWLHDAQKEHASVPAFARVSWLLAAAGAPAELLTWSHRAAIEEIAHTRACFALAAGYGGRSFTVEPMPDLLLGGLDGKVDPRVTLAIESLSDGCQLEDFNADVAAACAATCREPVTRDVLEMIAREERTHADFSWAVVDWLLENHHDTVRRPLLDALDRLDAYPRPTAVSADKRALVSRADVALLRAHGRITDEEWATCWLDRLAATKRRVADRLTGHRARTERCAA